MVAKTLTFAVFAAHEVIRPAFEAAKDQVADQNHSCFDGFTLLRPRESLCAPRDRGYQLAFGRRGRFAIQSRGIPSGSCACRKVVGGSSAGSCCSRELLGRYLARWLPGRRGHMLSGVNLLPPARGAPRGPGPKPPVVLAVLYPQNGLKRRPKGAGWGTGEVRAPRPGPMPPIAANRSTGPHSGDAHPFRRSGQLSAVATDAPVASTPPRRREPGR